MGQRIYKIITLDGAQNSDKDGEGKEIRSHTAFKAIVENLGISLRKMSRHQIFSKDME